MMSAHSVRTKALLYLDDKKNRENAVWPQSRRPGRFRLAENCADPGLAKVEDLLDIASDHKSMNKSSDSAQRQVVKDLISKPRALACSNKQMCVMPKLEGPAELNVNESVRRLPFTDLARPAQRQPAKTKPVLNDGSLADRFRRNAEDPEAEPLRRDGLQVLSAREKGKYLFKRPRNHLLVNDFVGICHCYGDWMPETQLRRILPLRGRRRREALFEDQASLGTLLTHA
jgi:hypothetical protein